MSWINNSIRYPEHLAARSVHIYTWCLRYVVPRYYIHLLFLYLRGRVRRARVCIECWKFSFISHYHRAAEQRNLQRSSARACDPLFIYSFEIIAISRCHYMVLQDGGWLSTGGALSAKHANIVMSYTYQLIFQLNFMCWTKSYKFLLDI
jgi:hypothetical protein